MRIQTALELAFACGVLLAAAILVAASLERVGRRLILSVAALLGAATTAAWIAFALDPERELAVAASGLTACALATLGAVGVQRGLASGRALETQLARIRQELGSVVERELRARAEELERTLARARADSLSSFVADERKRADERRSATSDLEQRVRAELTAGLASVQRQVEQRLGSWREDLERAQQALSTQLADLARRQQEAIAKAEARIVAEGDRLKTVDEEHKTAISRLREEVSVAGQRAAAAAQADLEAHAADRRRALQDLDERLRARERDFAQRIEREQAEAARRIEATFADVERRQVEQLERALERAASRFSDAAAQQFEASIKTAREDAARRLARELDRSVQTFAREGESVLAERLAQTGDAGGARLEKKLAQSATALERHRDEFVAATERRLAELDAEFRSRLSALVADEEAERAALEARLHELARRIDASLARAEERLTALQGSR